MTRLWLIACLALLAACTSREGQRFVRIQLTGEPTTLDPAHAEDGLSFKILLNLHEGLTGYGKGSQLEARWAERWDWDEGKLEWKFRLKEGARWSDGEPLVAEQFRAGLSRALRESSPLAQLYDLIQGARETREGGDPKALGIRAEGRDLVFSLRHPAPYFPHLLAIPPALPLRADCLDEKGRWIETGPTSGAYRLRRHELDRRYDLEPTRAGVLPASFVVIRDEGTALNLFESNGLDILLRVPSLSFEALSKKGLVHADPFPATYYLAFNTRKPPFQDTAARRAVSRAVSRPDAAKVAGTGETPALGWIPPGLEGHREWSEAALARDLDSSPASNRRSKPGTQGKPSPARITLQTDGGSRNNAIAELAQAALKKAGYEAEVQSLDWKSHVAKLKTDPAEIYRFGWLAAFADPLSHLAVFTRGNPNNYTGWSSAEYDRLVERVARMAPGPERTKLVEEADRLLVAREAVIIPLFHYRHSHAIREELRGLEMSALGVPGLAKLRWWDNDGKGGSPNGR